MEKEEYSWTRNFDSIKEVFPIFGMIRIKSKDRYEDPFTPRIPMFRGYALMYASYEPESNSLHLWAYTGKERDVHDEDDGSWGWWTEKEKIEGKRNRQGEWIEQLRRVWIHD